MVDQALRHGQRLVVIYHNVTPAAFFETADAALARQMALGREQLAVLRPALEQIARRFVRLFAHHVITPPDAKAPPRGAALRRVEHAVRRVRPLALQVVEVELAQALDREIRDQLTSELERALARRR